MFSRTLRSVSRVLVERAGARHFYQRDVQGDVRGLAGAGGAVLDRVDYEAFGQPIFDGGGSGSALGNPYLWRGWRYDAGDGLLRTGRPALRPRPRAGPATLTHSAPCRLSHLTTLEESTNP